MSFLLVTESHFFCHTSHSWKCKCLKAAALACGAMSCCEHKISGELEPTVSIQEHQWTNL